MRNLPTTQTERLLQRSLNHLPPARRATFEDTWRAELSGVPTDAERLDFARGLPAAARQLAWHFDPGARHMRPVMVLVGVGDALLLLDTLFFPDLHPTGVIGETLTTLNVGLHLTLAIWTLTRAYRRVTHPTASARTLRLAVITAGFLSIAAAAIWRGMVQPAGSPFLPFLMLYGLVFAVYDAEPTPTPAPQTT